MAQYFAHSINQVDKDGVEGSDCLSMVLANPGDKDAILAALRANLMVMNQMRDDAIAERAAEFTKTLDSIQASMAAEVAEIRAGGEKIVADVKAEAEAKMKATEDAAHAYQEQCNTRLAEIVEQANAQIAEAESAANKVIAEAKEAIEQAKAECAATVAQANAERDALGTSEQGKAIIAQQKRQELLDRKAAIEAEIAAAYPEHIASAPDGDGPKYRLPEGEFVFRDSSAKVTYPAAD